MTDQPPPSPAKKRSQALLAAVIAGVVVVVAAVYGIAALRGNAGSDKACRPAVALATKIAPLATGEVAAFNVDKRPLLLPNLVFQDSDGKPVHLTDFHGRTVLLNLWATWCVPCRREMPTLNALEAKLGAPDFQVVAVNIDTRNPEKPKQFLKSLKINDLAYYSDPSAKTFQDLKAIGRAFGLPTTLLVNPDGCEVGNIAGPADWASNDAIKLIRAALGKG